MRTTTTALLLSLLPLAGAFIDDNTVNLEFIGSANCGFTARFLRNQVSVAAKILGPTKRVNITFLPDSQCHDSNRNWLWCADDLNALDACVKEELPEDYLEPVTCIQLKDGLGDALRRCIRSTNLYYMESRLSRCARGYEGRRLLGRANDATHEHYMKYYRTGFRYPLIIINGERSLAAETNLMGVLCDKYLHPRPAECDSIPEKRRRW